MNGSLQLIFIIFIGIVISTIVVHIMLNQAERGQQRANDHTYNWERRLLNGLAQGRAIAIQGDVEVIPLPSVSGAASPAKPNNIRQLDEKWFK